MSVQSICTAGVFIPQRITLCQPPATSGRIRRKMTTDGSQTAWRIGRAGQSNDQTPKRPPHVRLGRSGPVPLLARRLGQHLADEVVARVGLDEVDEVGDGP